ncbi:polysaccharide lyase family 8 super-sandwich domain-containing protein [uncultured Fusobacterium sp.]|jgi:hyaluronate lyase|uniref:polysaccharide lyase family 8 super-sandwich domain-containing protein n=1 Tax=uncultured Fusobacterium sp. TaxID=159267 RepID=UPI0025FC1B5F|nr:polysaccharide lyase family 8 super-sandwich domain-containing protein [uncultured Fusobacterium sp.]
MIEYQKMIEKRIEFLTGNGEGSLEIIEFYNKEMEQIIEEISNLDYEETKDNIVKIKVLYAKLLLLCKGYYIKGTKYYNDESVVKFIEKKIEKFREYFYNLNSIEHTNWWQWEIGIPFTMNDIFMLMKGKIKDEIIVENLKTSRYFQPDPRYSGNNPVAIHPSGKPLRLSTGGNRVDTVKISLFRGILLEDEVEIKLALESLPEVWEYNEKDRGEGFYRDGSFIQHEAIPYAGGYGEVLLSGIGEILYVISDSEYTSVVKKVNDLYEIILNSFEPFFYNGSFTDMLSGRGIDRANNIDSVIGHRILNDILVVSSIFEDDKCKKLEDIVLREIVKYGAKKYLEEEKSPFLYKKLTDILEKYRGQEIEKYSNSIKVCNKMARVMKREEKYAFGIAMHSSTIGNYEAMNGENLKGWYTGDGAYYLYDGVNDYKDYWRDVDYYYIPGTTEIKMDMEGVDAQRNFESSFVKDKIAYGISQGENGLVAMEFLNWNERLKSRKTWGLIDSKIIFIETDIESEEKVYTTIFNRKYNNLPKILVDGQEIKEKYFNKKLSQIQIEELNIKFYLEENISFEVEEKDGYFIKIWKEYDNDDKKIIWGLSYNSEIDFKKDMYINLENNIHEIKTKEKIYKVNWNFRENGKEFCEILDIEK